MAITEPDVFPEANDIQSVLLTFLIILLSASVMASVLHIVEGVLLRDLLLRPHNLVSLDNRSPYGCDSLNPDFPSHQSRQPLLQQQFQCQLSNSMCCPSHLAVLQAGTTTTLSQFHSDRETQSEFHLCETDLFELHSNSKDLSKLFSEAEIPYNQLVESMEESTI